MKTFSAMSTPDKILTRKSYHMNLVIISEKISMPSLLPEETFVKLGQEATRLQLLIDVLDAELLNE